MSLPHSLETVRFSGVDCPKCRQKLYYTEISGPIACPECGWSGEIHILRPLRERAQQAITLAEGKASCAFHPTKQAVAVCAGTGSYICALCAVEMDGKVYSADYLNHAGKGALAKTHARNLDRPDTLMTWALLAGLFLPFIGLFAIPFIFYYFFKAIRMRRNDRYHKRILPLWKLIGLGGLALLISLYQLMYLSVFWVAFWEPR